LLDHAEYRVMRSIHGERLLGGLSITLASA